MTAGWVEPRWALLLGFGAESSREPRRGEAPTKSLFVRKPDPLTRAGRHFVSYLDRNLSNATNRPQRPPEVSSRHLGGAASGF